MRQRGKAEKGIRRREEETRTQRREEGERIARTRRSVEDTTTTC